MDYEVVKPFKSTNRRFTPSDGPGGVVKKTDDIAPHTIETLTARKFIEPKNEMVSGVHASSAPATAPAKDEDEK